MLCQAFAGKLAGRRRWCRMIRFGFLRRESARSQDGRKYCCVPMNEAASGMPLHNTCLPGFASDEK